jgi:hypothetical protein
MADAGTFWDREIIEQQYCGWLQEPALRDYANTLIGGERALWPIEWFPYPILVDDPSEAIRSSEIVEQLGVGFDVVAFRPYGGTLLSVIYPFLRQERLTSELGAARRERPVLAGSEAEAHRARAASIVRPLFGRLAARSA